MPLKEKIENHLNVLLPKRVAPYNLLSDSARHAVLSSGKRFRPQLTLLVNEAFGGDFKKAIASACAIEFVHKSSLIHDDLPCMDDDDLRDNQPTLHKLYPEWHALLTGNFLLTHAFTTIAQDKNLLPKTKVQLIKILGNSASIDGMLTGQAMDLHLEGKSVDTQTIFQINEKKTAALIEASIAMGSLIAGKEPTVLNTYAKTLGSLYQIVDDFMDIEQDDTKKLSLIKALGKHQAKNLAIEMYQKANHEVKQNLPNPKKLLELNQALINKLEQHTKKTPLNL